MRFREGDAVDRPRFLEGPELRDPQGHREEGAAKKAAAKKAAKAAKAAMPEGRPGRARSAPSVIPNGVVVRQGRGGATLSVETAQGTLPGPARSTGRRLDRHGPRWPGRGPARLPARAAGRGPDQQDFPAAAPIGQDGAWVAYVEHEPRGPELLPSLTERPKDFADFRPAGGGDQVRLLRLPGRQGRASRSTSPARASTSGGPPSPSAGDGSVVVVWTEKRDDNWDLFGRRYDPATGVVVGPSSG